LAGPVPAVKRYQRPTSPGGDIFVTENGYVLDYPSQKGHILRGNVTSRNAPSGVDEGEREAGEGMGVVESRRGSAGEPSSGRRADGEMLCGQRVASETRREGSAGMVAEEWGHGVVAWSQKREP